MNNYHWDSNLKIRLVGETLFNLLYWMYFPFIAIYFSQTMGLKWAGVLMTIPPVISLIGNMVGGDLADKIGRRPVMLTGAIIQTGMFALFALSATPWLDYFAFIGISIGGALYGPASDAMVADLVVPDNRKQVFATFITARNIGAVLGPVFGAILFFQYREEILWTCMAVMLLYSIVIFIKIKETVPQIQRESSTSIFISVKNQWTSYRALVDDKKFMYYIVAGVFSVIAIMQLDLYFAIYITQYVPGQALLSWNDWDYTLSSSEILGWVLGLNGILFVLFVLPVTKWLKKWSDRNVFVLSCVLAGGGMFAVGLTTNLWILFGLTIIFTFGEIVRSPVLYNFVSDHAPENARGQYMAASNMQFTIGRCLAPLTVFFSSWLPPIGIFSMILCSAMVSLLLYLKIFK